MKTIRRIFDLLSRYGWTATLVALAAIALGFTWSSTDELFNQIRLFDRIALMVDYNYVEGLDEGKMVRAGIDGMLSKLDKYTKFLDGGEYIRLQQTTDGSVEGIGVYLEYHHDTLTVTGVIDAAPGYKVGMKPGDRILKIDSVETSGLEMDDVRMLLSGEKGTPVELRIARPGESRFSVTVLRDDISVEAIPYHDLVSDSIGYVRILKFSEGCSVELQDAITDLKKKGMNSLIIDLRGNPGGLLAEAIDVASLFLPENSTIVETKGRDGDLSASFTSQGNHLYSEGDLAVIVDEHTASAAEIVAGAIQDHDRGVIIGTATYGKGLVQQVLPVSDKSALKITTSRYHLPSGRCLQKPDWTTFELCPDGTAETESDSVHYTFGGRLVFGGMGVIPDINVEPIPENEYAEALKRESIFFDFATDYINHNHVPVDFRADSSAMEGFREFVDSRDFHYREKGRSAFDSLRSDLKSSDSETRNAIAVLERNFELSESSGFDSGYDAVRRTLTEAIVLQKYGEEGLCRTMAKNSPEVAEAIEVLANPDRYVSVLAQR